MRDLAYRFYVTDCLKMLTLNTAKIGGGDFVRGRFAEQIAPCPHTVDDRTAEEIIEDVVRRAGLEVKKTESI